MQRFGHSVAKLVADHSGKLLATEPVSFGVPVTAAWSRVREAVKADATRLGRCGERTYEGERLNTHRFRERSEAPIGILEIRYSEVLRYFGSPPGLDEPGSRS